MKSIYLEKYDCYVRYFVRKGTDEIAPVVFIPGLITPAVPLFFDMINHLLLRNTTVILINYVGTGISDHIADPDLFDHHPRSHAKIIQQILDQEPVVKDRKFHIMGHSQGGTVGIFLAKIYKSRILSLIISEGNLFAGGGPGTRYIASFTEEEFVENAYHTMLKGWREKGKNDPNMAALPAFQQTSHPAAIYRAAYQLVHLDPDVFEILSTGLDSIECHFIYGSKNVPQNEEEAMPDTPLKQVLEAVGVFTHIVENSGHMMMLDNLDCYTKIIKTILSQAQ